MFFFIKTSYTTNISRTIYDQSIFAFFGPARRIFILAPGLTRETMETGETLIGKCSEHVKIFFG